MPIYEVIKSGLIKAGSIEEYQIGERFKSDVPLKNPATLGRVQVLNAAGQVEFVNQLEAKPQVEVDQDEVTAELEQAEEPQEEINVIEVSFDVDKADKQALLAKAKELGIKGAHLFGEKRLREEVALLLDK